MKEKRRNIDGDLLLVDWNAQKKVTRGLAKGIYYKTFFDFPSISNPTFANWRTKKDIEQLYPLIDLTT